MTEVHQLVDVVENQGLTQKPKAVKVIGPLVGPDQNLDRFQSTEGLVLNRQRDHVIEVPREKGVGENQGQAQNLMDARTTGPLVVSDRNLDPVPDTEGNPVRILKNDERGVINIPDPNHHAEDGPVHGLKQVFCIVLSSVESFRTKVSDQIQNQPADKLNDKPNILLYVN